MRSSAIELSEQVQRGELHAEQIAETFLQCVRAHNERLNALLWIDEQRTLAAAKAVDDKRKRGEKLGKLAGVPVIVKDNLCARGWKTTCGSKILANYVAPYDAHVIERLAGADAILLAKSNMDEFAMGSSNEHSAFGAVKNPWDETRAPGGSSGGSAASVAAGFAPIALGSDTGGSVRQPAAFCGVTAIKPTYGTVSRYGLVAFASSLDQVGPLAANVADASRVLSVIGGHDPRDATSLHRDTEDYEAALGRDVRGLRVGLVKGLDEAGNDADVQRAFVAATEKLRALGCVMVDVTLPHLSHAVATYYLVATAEASSNLARFDGMRYGLRVTGQDLLDTYGATRTAGFGPEVKRRIMLGTYALSAGYYDAYYLKAQKVRTLIAQDYVRAFESCDVIATPTAPTPAFRLGEKTADPLAMYLADVYTLPPSLAGIPALSTPCGMSETGLPIGLQLTAPAFQEGRLIALTHAFEQLTGLKDLRPASYS